MRQKVFGNKMSCRGLRRKQKGPLGPCPKTYACACANKMMFFLGQKQIGHTPVIPCTELGPKFLKTCPRALKNKLLAFFRKLAISSCYSARRAEARGPNIKCARATKTKTVGVWWKLGTRILGGPDRRGQSSEKERCSKVQKHMLSNGRKWVENQMAQISREGRAKHAIGPPP